MSINAGVRILAYDGNQVWNGTTEEWEAVKVRVNYDYYQNINNNPIEVGDMIVDQAGKVWEITNVSIWPGESPTGVLDTRIDIVGVQGEISEGLVITLQDTGSVAGTIQINGNNLTIEIDNGVSTWEDIRTYLASATTYILSATLTTGGTETNIWTLNDSSQNSSGVLGGQITINGSGGNNGNITVTLIGGATAGSEVITDDLSSATGSLRTDQINITAEPGSAGNVTVSISAGGTAGSETVVLSGSTLTVTIEDGVSTQQQICDALTAHALIATAIAAVPSNPWDRSAGSNFIALTGGSDVTIITCQIEDGVSTQQQISDALITNTRIATATPTTAGDPWTLGGNAGADDTVDLTGGYTTTDTCILSGGTDSQNTFIVNMGVRSETPSQTVEPDMGGTAQGLVSTPRTGGIAAFWNPTYVTDSVARRALQYSMEDMGMANAGADISDVMGTPPPPADLDTLSEISSAIGNNSTFSTFVLGAINNDPDMYNNLLALIRGGVAANLNDLNKIAIAIANDPNFAATIKGGVVSTLDSLNKIAQAINNDPGFYGTLMGLVGTDLNNLEKIANAIDNDPNFAATIRNEMTTATGMVGCTIEVTNWLSGAITPPTYGGAWTINKINDDNDMEIIHPLGKNPVGWFGMNTSSTPKVQIIQGVTRNLRITTDNSTVVISNCVVANAFNITLYF